MSWPKNMPKVLTGSLDPDIFPNVSFEFFHTPSHIPVVLLSFKIGPAILPNFFITSNTFSFSHTLANDLADEGDENLQIKLFTDAARNNQVGNTLAVTIKDTSQVGFNVIVTAPNNNEYILVGNDTDGTI